MNLLLMMIRCLVLTILVELILGLILRIRDKKDIINLILVNIVTNPIVVMAQVILYKYFGHNAEIIGIIIMEILAVLIEGLIYKKVLKYKKINPIILSLILNTTSFFIGELINRL